MTDIISTPRAGAPYQTDDFAARLKKRYAAERRFKMYGMAAIGVALAMLAILLASIVAQGYTAFAQHDLALEVHFDPAEIDPQGTRDPDALSNANYGALARNALLAVFPEVESRNDRRRLTAMISNGAAFELRRMVMDDPSLIGTRKSVRFALASDYDQLLKGNIDRTVPEADRKVTDQQIAWIDRLVSNGSIVNGFNWRLFLNGDSRDPELAGLKAGIIGSFLTLLVTLGLAIPIGISAAVYLEEFAPKNKLTDLIEVNINNLAAVPSIVFGLLGLAVFLNALDMPRSAPVVGGIVLALMTLPTIIISGRAALKAVPPSIREAALGVGASPLQVVTHHVLPLAMPGMLTGIIIGMAQALGETAPLLMIGMIAFIVDTPSGFGDAATVLPVQIFMWADSPERGFVERTSAAIMVLLAFLIAMNAIAVVLRKQFERRW
ncbi:phosphate ABC transporter permease PstA [Skermanella sp. TT6]|uniref:Phosphate transport system permease protein PstA n=1 Tax=Skermanella cutis TaxID=2775420 RepID=A0ABX7B5S6_9PROT|nr:phosphate ABC transporter permease PstA [Skermanella sp. TT6]QQP89696.1 phosphate ABC transporter permease PstA [Skermanella sp. TT6]